MNKKPTEKAIETIENAIKNIEKSIDNKAYSKELLKFINSIERMSFRLLYRGFIRPSNDEEDNGRKLLLIEYIEYVLKLFPSYSQEVKEALDQANNTKPKTNLELTENQKETIKKILPKINHYISENSTFEQWEKVFTAQEPSNKIKIKCSNKLLADFISRLKIKFNLNIADAFFSNCFEGNKPISHRFIGVGTSRPPTDEDRNKLEEIFKAVQK